MGTEFESTLGQFIYWSVVIGFPRYFCIFWGVYGNWLPPRVAWRVLLGTFENLEYFASVLV